MFSSPGKSSYFSGLADAPAGNHPLDVKRGADLNEILNIGGHYFAHQRANHWSML
jgi:hypothetical protein